MNHASRRISYVFLCALPLFDVPVIGMRALRIPGVYQPVGVILFAAIVIAAWTLGARAIASRVGGRRRLAAAGILLILPWAINSLLWVGLGAPFQATRAENYMRFLVLLADSMIIAGAFVALKEELYDAGERFYSTLGFAASVPAGTAYLVCMSIIVASYVEVLGGKGGSPPQLFNSLFSVLEFVACVMTYIATASFAASFGEARWLGLGPARTYVVANLVLVSLIVARGLSYPDLSSGTAPWYVQPGFIAGIPAVPWIMPGWLGVLLLRRAGNEPRVTDNLSR